MNEIPARLAAVRERIRQAADAGGRDPDAVRLLAVSKTKPVELLMDAYNVSLARDFGCICIVRCDVSKQIK